MTNPHKGGGGGGGQGERARGAVRAFEGGVTVRRQPGQQAQRPKGQGAQERGDEGQDDGGEAELAVQGGVVGLAEAGLEEGGGGDG